MQRTTYLDGARRDRRRAAAQRALPASIIGVAAGSVLGDPETLGLDAAFPALFLALLAGQVQERRLLLAVLDARAAGLAAALVAVALRAPVLVVILAAALTAGGLRAIS